MPRKTKQNDITSIELIAKINPKNIRLMDEFLVYLKSLKRSEKTLHGYKNDIQIFFVFLLQKCDNKFFVDINKRDIIAYQNWLLYDHENSPARIRRLKSTLSSMSNYLENICDDLYPDYKSIVRKVETIKNEPVREKTVFEDEQLEKLLTCLVDTGKHMQACCVALGMFSGARKSELMRFEVSFFKDENVLFGSLYKTPKIKTKGQAGGKYISKFVLKHEFDKYLNLWLKERKELGIDSKWLFVYKDKTSGDWEQLKADTLNSWAVTFSNILGVDFYFHSLRHFWTTTLVKKGFPNNVIKDLTGWESEEMCSRYTDLSEEDTFSKYFDENGVKEVKKPNLMDL